MRRSSPIALLVLVLASRLVAGAASASGVRLVPLGQQSAVASPAAGGSSTADPRLEALRAGLLQARNVVLAAAPASLDAGQRRALERLEKRAGGSVELHLRAETGTPRLLRAPHLHPRVAARAGEDADLATANAFLADVSGLLRLDDPSQELALARRQTDMLGKRQLRFAQRYHGRRVWPAELVVQLGAEGDVESLSGASVPTPTGVAAAAAIPQADAVARARAAVPDAAAAKATASAELLVHAPGDRPPALAWLVVLSAGLASRWQVVVDASDGSIRERIDAIQRDNVRGSGIDLFGVRDPLDVWAESGTNFLVDTSKPMFDASSDPPAPDTTRGGIIVLDAQNRQNDGDNLSVSQVTSDDANAFAPPDAVSAAIGLSRTFDYYAGVHQRSSIDGAGGTMLAVVRYGVAFRNAFWNGSLMVFGDAQPYARALDVVAHELTHGVTQFTANLVYSNQSGALNEAISDIFGESTEAQVKGAADWLLGADLGAPFRNMRDPGSLTIGNTGRPYPARMSELIGPDDPFLDQFQNRDNGGVHLNSGIVNHAFYLLAEGLPGALGIADAARIFYRALTAHLVANSQFIDARLACLQAVDELFPGDAARHQRVADAFDGVEIFDGGGTPPPPSYPGTSGDDAVLFVAYSPTVGAHLLSRRENALGDPVPGNYLVSSPAAAVQRPAVTGDGQVAAFVTHDADLCFLATNDPSMISCLGQPGTVYAISLSPDGTLAGVVLLGPTGPEDAIRVIELRQGGGAATYPLRAPALDGGGFDTVLYAEAMDFTADDRFLVYDALNVISLVDGSQETRWSIYALDVALDATYVLVPPTAGVNIAYPSLAQTSDRYLVFDARNDAGDSAVQAGDLTTGALTTIGVVTGSYGAPAYTGDDAAVVVSVPDSGQPSGYSLVSQPMASDHVTPQGDATLLVPDGLLGTIYRRGIFRGPGSCTSDAACADSDPCSDDACDASGVCQHLATTGVRSASCVFVGDPVGGACGGDAGYGKLAAKVTAASHLVDRAGSASKARKARGLLRRAAKTLTRAGRIAGKLQRKGKLSDGCVAATRAFVMNASARARAAAAAL